MSLISHCHPSVEGTRDIGFPAENTGMNPNPDRRPRPVGKLQDACGHGRRQTLPRAHHAKPSMWGERARSWPLVFPGELCSSDAASSRGHWQKPLSLRQRPAAPVHPQYLTQLDPT